MTAINLFRTEATILFFNWLKRCIRKLDLEKKVCGQQDTQLSETGNLWLWHAFKRLVRIFKLSSFVL